ncbi:bifunctional DnaQ family exonuclease/ATP-dependent helicase [Streptococcus pluranimalium]|uniref:bifunctional DnaQ family exonuclease/ATP-dependent helicase n=1 Tax=Streptococcus pluranimalium TaxID=82348 RepID=UPI002415122E|nr:bifunctional DnaQ family exonuclease/ATP-dependent helicase [Streptococcus pluranimalium]WFM79206.1 bifunctional DnaQ family exonuclease/ATP-dependent helicase [Streptococcus pluranimalium]
MTKSKQKYAVIDLEATGASIMAQIIQVGIVIIQGDKIIETYQTDVNPHEPLSEHIIQLTGITDQQLAKAPDFSQVAREIYELIEDCVFVAHNVKFDANLLSEQLFMEGFELRPPRVDTVELAQVFFPSMEKYSLGELTRALDIPLEDAHTAIADAQATAQLFFKIRDKMASLPSLTLEKIKSYADHLIFESRLLIDEAPLDKDYDHSLYQEVGGILIRKPQLEVEEKKYSQDFTTNMALLGLDSRPKQDLFAQAILQEEKEIHFIQAQAGIGKTYAYLLPLLAKNEKQRLIISVPTKLLQDQIVAQEAKKIHEVFGTSYQSLKGPANYLKLDAFKASLDQDDDNRLLNRYKMQLLVWLLETQDGDLNEIKQQQRLQWYFDSLRHDGELSAHSLFAQDDFWLRSYEKAKSSRLLITNHAYLLTRLEDDPSLIERGHLVIDEAQKFFLTLEDFSHAKVNLLETLAQLETMLEETDQLLTRRLIESLQFELSHLVVDYHQSKEELVPNDKWQKIRRDIVELNHPDLEALNKIADRRYDAIWIDSRQENEKRSVYLKGASQLLLDFSPFLPENQKTSFVSATLSISPQVSLPQLLGFSDYQETIIEDSKNVNQAIWIASQGVPPALSGEDYHRELANKIYRLSQLNLPTLVLFTSKDTLEQVSNHLQEAGLSHLAQGKNGSSHQMKRRFEAEESAILLGTGSFWEGVDFTNHDQLLLVITRLPFENPQDFLNQKMANRLSQEGKNPFTAYSLPVMMMRLKQALGRTSRRPNQKSAALILDTRLLEKSYGPSSLEILRKTHQVWIEKNDKILSDILDFLL